MSKVLSGEEVAADRKAAQKTTEVAVSDPAAEPGNQLAVIIKESGLETTKAQVMLDEFSGYFKLAGQIEAQAKTLEVKDITETLKMKMAKTARLELKAMRVKVENTRVRLKADVLLQSKAIDGIANNLKAVIKPTEDWLADQEKFKERQEAAALEARRQAAEEALQEKEAADAAEEAVRIKEQAVENERLRKENEVKDLALEAERKDAADKLAAQQKANDAKVARERKKAAADAKAAADKAAEVAKQEAEKKAKEDAKVAAAKAKADREKAAAAAKVVAERNRVEIERVAKENAEREAAHKEAMRQARMVTCPHCGETFENAPKEQKI